MGAPVIAKLKTHFQPLLEKACECCDSKSLIGITAKDTHDARKGVWGLTRGPYDIITGITQGFVPFDYDTKSIRFPDNYKYTIGSFDVTASVEKYSCREGVAILKFDAVNYLTTDSLLANPIAPGLPSGDRYQSFVDVYEDALGTGHYSAQVSVYGHNFGVSIPYPTFKMNKGWPTSLVPDAGEKGVFGLMKHTAQHFNWDDIVNFRGNPSCE